jgi:hypothetical protein
MSFTRDGADIRPTHALAAIGPNDMTIFVSTIELTCASVHGVATMNADGISALVPTGPDRDYYAGKRVGVPVWALGPDDTFVLHPAFGTVAIDRLDAKARHVSGELRFAGVAKGIGSNGHQRIAGGGHFDADICDELGLLASPPQKPALHLDAPFAGRIAGRPFAIDHALAIVCGTPGKRFVSRLLLAGDEQATCASPWHGLHAELEDLGGSAEGSAVLHAIQPGGATVGDTMGAEARDGTASVVWDHLDYSAGGTITGAAAVDGLGDQAKEGGAWTDASGKFEARVCEDLVHVCAVTD